MNCLCRNLSRKFSCFLRDTVEAYSISIFGDCQDFRIALLLICTVLACIGDTSFGEDFLIAFSMIPWTGSNNSDLSYLSIINISWRTFLENHNFYFSFHCDRHVLYVHAAAYVLMPTLHRGAHLYCCCQWFSLFDNHL